MRRLPPEVEALVHAQAGILARRQLTALGFGWEAVDAQVAGRRWVVRTPRVISTVTGTLTLEQRRWVAVLHAGPRSRLGGLSAAAHLGLRGWERDVVTVLVEDELAFEPVPGVQFFRSRRPLDVLAGSRPGVPSLRLEPALLLWAGYSAPPRPAVGALAAAVQQRLTTPPCCCASSSGSARCDGPPCSVVAFRTSPEGPTPAPSSTSGGCAGR